MYVFNIFFYGLCCLYFLFTHIYYNSSVREVLFCEGICISVFPVFYLILYQLSLVGVQQHFF